MEATRDQVVLVNEIDEPLGTMDKLEAHREGVLHRAFSVFVLNDKNELLLQQRAMGKYHSEGLWSNTCCSHPFPGENTLDAAHRRLQEEMGFDCALQHIFALRYCSDVSNELTENELDHVYIGYYTGEVIIDPKEASDYKFVALDEIQRMLRSEPKKFTAWFHLALPRLIDHLQKKEKAA